MASHTKTMWHHVRRSPYQALSAILIMMIMFLMLTVFSVLIIGFHQTISYFASRPQVTAFFKDEAKKEDIDSLKNQLNQTDKVAKMTYVSKDQALKIYREQNKNDPLLLELVTADILPASLEISTYNINDLGVIAKSLTGLPIIQEVVYQKDVINRLTEWIVGIRQIGLALIILLAIESILVMSIIISIRIAQKKEEIEIMRLIGATDWYIAMPFLYEGMFYGVVGSFIGWIIASAGIFYYTSTPSVITFFQGIPLLPVSPLFFLEILGGELLLAVILGSISSMIAVNRYVNK